ncbi:MAG: hypothetical protein FWE98_00200 [Oscillospiraceae bacterium]|nr:hypothetical protein [Oscillospiraceae bacterium]
MTGFDERGMAHGLRKLSISLLTEDEIAFIRKEIEAIEADESVFRFDRIGSTGYLDELDYIAWAAMCFRILIPVRCILRI